MVQLGGLPMLDFTADLCPPFQMINSVANSYVEELNDTDTKKLNSNILVDTGLNIIGKKNCFLILIELFYFLFVWGIFYEAFQNSKLLCIFNTFYRHTSFN